MHVKIEFFLSLILKSSHINLREDYSAPQSGMVEEPKKQAIVLNYITQNNGC